MSESKNVKRDEFDFEDLALIRFPVRIRGDWYVACEADGETGTQYRNRVFASVRASKGGEDIGVSGLASVEPFLVRRCLSCAIEDSEGEEFAFGKYTVKLKTRGRVTEDFVKGLPSRVLKVLFEKLKNISELDIGGDLAALKKQRSELDKKITDIERVEDSAKNEPSSTTDGSE